MKKILCISMAVVAMSNISLGQSKEEKAIVREGRILYRSEMASWYGTDIFVGKFERKRQNAGGYFSYIQNDRTICLFFSKNELPKVLASFSFDSTFNVRTAIVDGRERELSTLETDIWTIRQSALQQIKKDTLFRSFKNMSPNLIPLADENGKRVYILTGPQKDGVVVFGNDYLLTFNDADKLTGKKRLHKNIITLEYGNKDDEVTIATMHTHLPETGDLITATDICTLMLYEKYAKWKQHIVISKKYVSLWDCDKDQLMVMARKAWDKILKEQKK
jgi:hypothetical protein